MARKRLPAPDNPADDFQRGMRPPPPPHPAVPVHPDNPAQIAGDFQRGMRQLIRDVFNRWANWHTDLARGPDLTQGQLATELGIDEAGFSHFLSDERGITVEAAAKMQIGFVRLSQKRGFAFTPLEFPDSASLGLAGWLAAVNLEGRRQGVTRRVPFGVVHYYCLDLMFLNKGWYQAIAGRSGSRPVEELAGNIVTQASRLAQEIRFVLRTVAQADRTNPVAATHADLRDLVQVWIEPWRVVYNCMGRANE